MSHYFSGANRRGELQELKEELNSADFERMKEAIKRVIALMTLGKDLSPLFHCVVKCLEMNDIEIKKLVYLYIINYSRNKPDDALIVIHLFRKVSYISCLRNPPQGCHKSHEPLDPSVISENYGVSSCKEAERISGGAA